MQDALISALMAMILLYTVGNLGSQIVDPVTEIRCALSAGNTCPHNDGEARFRLQDVTLHDRE